MNSEISQRSISRRLKFLGIVFIVLGLVFVGRLLERQVFQRGTFAAQAEKQYYTKIDEPAKRGEIYIRDKDSENLIDSKLSGLFPVATNIELYDVLVTPRNVEDKKYVAKKLSEFLGESEEKIFNDINQDKWYVPPIKKRVSKEVADKIAAEKMKGVYLESQYSRVYPEKEFLAHVLGFVDYDGNGRYGTEEKFDGLLKGEGGMLKGLKDNTGKIIKVQESSPGKAGASVVLTIDRSIQYMVEKKLKEGIEQYGAEGGSIMVMDPKDGAILAMASYPVYDPNKFNEVKSEQQNIFLNPVVSSNWEPGSVFKPVIISAALKDKKVEPDTKPESPFSNFVVVDGYEIHNSQDKPFGFETVTQILENSDNVGMVWVANKMTDEYLGGYLEKLGFGKKTGIDLAGESPGQLANPKKWRAVNRATISFGQGISTTPIQIVTAYSMLANHGKLVKPHLLDSVIEEDGKVNQFKPEDTEEILSDEETKKIVEMLVSVVERGHGKKAKVEGFRVAGKTGTAQIPKPDGGYYEENIHMGSFAGFAPADDPKFVMLVKFDKPKNVEWAESSAAPIFGEIANWLLNSYLKIPKTQ